MSNSTIDSPGSAPGAPGDSPGADRESLIQPGETAPDFELQDQHRRPWRLSEAVKRGDVVLCFFPFAFTGVCSAEMKCVTDEIDRWRGGGAEVVGVSCDSTAALKAWAEQMGLEQTLLSDMHRRVCRAYGLYWPELNVARRGTVVIGGDASGVGKVKWSQGREPGVAMDFSEVLGRIG